MTGQHWLGLFFLITRLGVLFWLGVALLFPARRIEALLWAIFILVAVTRDD